MPELVALAARKGIWLVEDAAHAHGSSLGGTMAGAFGIAGAFSFYPTKVMTSAEGGMIVTDDDASPGGAQLSRSGQGELRTQRPHTARLQLASVRAARHHWLPAFQRLPAMIAARQRIAALYDAALRRRSLRPLAVPTVGASNYYKYIAMLRTGSIARI